MTTSERTYVPGVSLMLYIWHDISMGDDYYMCITRIGVFSPFQINTKLFFFKMAAGPIGAINIRVIPLCVINGYAKYEVDRWIYNTVRDATSFLSILYKMAARGHFVSPIDAKNQKVHGEYEFDLCICDKVMAFTSAGVRRRHTFCTTPKVSNFGGIIIFQKDTVTLCELTNKVCTFLS